MSCEDWRISAEKRDLLSIRERSPCKEWMDCRADRAGSKDAGGYISAPSGSGNQLLFWAPLFQ